MWNMFGATDQKGFLLFGLEANFSFYSGKNRWGFQFRNTGCFGKPIVEVFAFECSILVKVEDFFAVADSSLARFLQSRQRDFQKKRHSIVARASFS